MNQFAKGASGSQQHYANQNNNGIYSTTNSNNTTMLPEVTHGSVALKHNSQ